MTSLRQMHQLQEISERLAALEREIAVLRPPDDAPDEQTAPETQPRRRGRPPKGD